MPGFGPFDSWADTTTPHGRLIITVLGSLAEFERELIRSRTGEGRARAKANGVKMGRKSKLSPHQILEARDRRAKWFRLAAEQGDALAQYDLGLIYAGGYVYLST